MLKAFPLCIAVVLQIHVDSELENIIVGLLALSPFLTMFSKEIFPRVIKSRDQIRNNSDTNCKHNNGHLFLRTKDEFDLKPFKVDLFNPLSDDKSLDWSKLEGIADDKL